MNLSTMDNGKGMTHESTLFNNFTVMPRTRQLAAIMFTDIAGYTALMQRDEEQAIQTRERHREVFNSTTLHFNGRILQYYGDGTLSIFDSAIDAVECAIAMQRGFREEPSIPIRIGIHTGDIVFSDEEIIGDSVNIASRIESLAKPGSILVSEKVYDEIKNQDTISTAYLRAYNLKNVERPMDVYAIANEGILVPDVEDAETVDPIPGESGPSTNGQGGLLDNLLTTKLYKPPARTNVVERPRLIQQLNNGLEGRLSLISAPAGFGKTTLASEWIANNERPSAWLALDDGDNDPNCFLAYLIAALRTILNTIGDRAVNLLQAPQPPPPDAVLTSLINDISGVQESFILVLDDFHVINSPEVTETVNFIIENLPPQMHLAITTRRDPDLPLPRLRVRRQLTEVRPTDLRFTQSEAAGFLNTIMGLNLSEKDIEILENRTEGWIAGLQLAALSMQGRDDIAGFIKSFAGHDRFVVDYLVDEVLESLPEETRNFLLQTSILGRLNISLCDAVTERNDAKDILNNLEQSNLFLIPLDDKREWYRYHHLFADVLYSHLEKEHPKLINTLHLRASAWYQQNDAIPESIRHSLDAGDHEHAANLIEYYWPVMDQGYQSDKWLSWARQLPGSVIDDRPAILIGYAWSVLNTGELEAAEVRLNQAEKWLNDNPDRDPWNIEGPPPSLNMFRLPSIRAEIGAIRAYISQSVGDYEGTIRHCQEALREIPEDDKSGKAAAKGLMAMAFWSKGELDKTLDAISDFNEKMLQIGNITYAISTAFAFSNIMIYQGRLRDAVESYTKFQEILDNYNGPTMVGTGDFYMGLSELHYEKRELEELNENLEKVLEYGEDYCLPDWKYRYNVYMTRIEISDHNYDKALDHVEKAEKFHYRRPVPEFLPYAALRAEILVRKGELAEAENWVREKGLSPDDELDFLNEYNHLTLARLLVARFEENGDKETIKEALQLLERLEEAAVNGRRMGMAMEIRIVKALAYNSAGDDELSSSSLESALELAAPEGFVRVFTDEGEPLRQLLSELATHGKMKQYAQKLLAFFDKQA